MLRHAGSPPVLAAQATIHLSLSSHARRIIAERGLANPFALGLQVVAMFFSLAVGSEARRKAALLKIADLPGVSWVAQYGGRAQCGVILHSSSIQQALDDLDEINGAEVRYRSVAIRTCYYQFRRKYLAAKLRAHEPYLSLTVPEVQVTLTPEDREIIQAVSNTDFESLREIARKLGQPIATVQRRVAALEKAHILKGFYYAVSPAKLGVTAHKLLVSAHGGGKSFAGSIFEFCRQNTRVVYLMRTLGSWDFEIGVECSESSQTVQVVAELYDRFGPAIERIETLSEFEVLKYSLFP